MYQIIGVHCNPINSKFSDCMGVFQDCEYLYVSILFVVLYFLISPQSIPVFLIDWLDRVLRRIVNISAM